MDVHACTSNLSSWEAQHAPWRFLSCTHAHSGVVDVLLRSSQLSGGLRKRPGLVNQRVYAPRSVIPITAM